MLVPNKLKNKSFYIYKNITIFDIFIGFILFGLCTSIAYFTNNFSKWVRILIFLILFGLSCLLLVYNNTHSCKNYVFLYRMLKFYIDTGFGTNNHQLHIPYRHLEKNFIWIKNGKGKDSQQVIGFLEIEGFDISIYDDKEIERCVEVFKNVFKFCKTRISIVKIQDYLTVEENIEYYEENKQFIQSKEKLKFLDSYFNDLGRIEQNSKINKYYLVIYEKSVEKLEFLLNEIGVYLRACKLENKVLGKQKVLKLLNQVNLLDSFQWSHLNTLDEEDFLFKHYRHKKIIQKPGFFIHEKKYYSVQSIENFHFTMHPSWAKAFFESESSVIWHIDDVDSETTKRLLNTSIIDLRIKQELEKNSVNRSRYIFEREALEELSTSIAAGKNSLKNNSIFLLTQADSKQELQRIKNQNIKNSLHINCKLSNLNFLQLHAYQQLFFANTGDLKFSNEIPVDTIAESWPFYTNSLNDRNLLFLGRTKDQNFLIWNQFWRDQNRKNFNMFILGNSGSGKSSLTKKILINHLVFNHKVIVIDPEREYIHLQKIFKGSWIELGQGRKTCINPLQIRLRLDGEESAQNSQIISTHVRWVELWFRTLYGDLEEEMLRLISFSVVTLYQNWGFYENDFNLQELKPEDFPRIQDLIEILEKPLENQSNENREKLLFFLKTDFGQNGKFFDIYNGYTNISFENNFLVFDVQNLYEVETNYSIKTAFLTILSLIQDQIASNYNAKNDTKIIICIDEAHLLLDDSNPQILNYLIRTTKRIRKYKGGIILTTQNPTDFNISSKMSNKTQAIINNMQYAVFLNMKNKDVEIVDKMFSHVGGLADYEKKFLTTAQVGQCIFALDNIKRFILSINYNHLEKKTIFRS